MALSLAACSQPESIQPNILLVTLDTTRSDRLGCYGYDQDTSPELDRLASESIVYHRAYSTSSWTLPAHASLFTGKFPSSHGARYEEDGPLKLTSAIDGPKAWDQIAVRTLAANEITIAEILQKNGYRTGAAVGGPWLKRIFGLSKGFEFYDDDGISSVNGRAATDVSDAGIRFLDQMDDRPFFLFLNYFDAHFPYKPPAAFRPLFHNEVGSVPQSRLYDAEIRYADLELGRLVTELRERGLYDETLILVTADHGELLGEHGTTGHSDFLYQEVIRIPLILKLPASNRTPLRPEDSPIQLLDLFPMILAHADISAPPGIQAALPSEPRHPIVAEIYPSQTKRRKGNWRVLIEDHWKLLWSSTGAHALFDLDRDPEESVNRMSEFPERGRSMAAALERYLEALPEPGPAGPPARIDAETERALQELGYIE